MNFEKKYLSGGSKASWMHEPFLAGSHFFGAALSVLGVIFLVSQCALDFRKMLVIGIYGISLISLFLASGFLHSYSQTHVNSKLLEKLDYMAIYVFIAGSYTPLCVFILNQSWGTAILGLQWLMAAIGIFCTAKWGFACKKIQIGVFLAMGWMFLLTLQQVAITLDSRSFALLITGGLFYSIGAFIFGLAPQYFWRLKINSHGIWHVFVLCGAAAHYLMICNFMIV